MAQQQQQQRQQRQQQQEVQRAAEYQQADYREDYRPKSNFNPPPPPPPNNFPSKKNNQQQHQNQQPQRQQQKVDNFYYIRVCSLPITGTSNYLWAVENAFYDSWGRPYLMARKTDRFGGFIIFPSDGATPQIIDKEDDNFDDFKADVDFTMGILEAAMMGVTPKRTGGGIRTKIVYQSDWRLKAITVLMTVGCLYLLFFRG